MFMDQSFLTHPVVQAFFLETPVFRWMNQQNLPLIAPELIILVVLLFTIIQSMSNAPKGQTQAEACRRISMLGLIFTLVTLVLHFILLYVPVNGHWGFYPVLGGVFQADLISWVLRFILVLGTSLVMLFSRQYILERSDGMPGEFYTLLLSALLGGMMMVGASDLILLFIALETLSISSYILAGYLRSDTRSAEAALKYLLYGGANTAVMLFGFSLLYGFSGGQTQYSQIAAAFHQIVPTVGIAHSALPGFLLPVALTMTLGAFAYKLSAAPFHMWAPDVYEGSPTPVTAFLSVVSKTAGFAVVLRFIAQLNLHQPALVLVFATLSIASMVIGNLLALKQSNIKRLLAYSTIAHAGYLLLGIVTFTASGLALGLTNLVFYLLVYLMMNLGAFAVVVLIGQQLGSDQTRAYAGLISKRPVLVFALTVFLLSLAGIPVTAGFFAKFFLFQALSSLGFSELPVIVIALLTSVASLYYYLNLIRLMVVATPSEEVKALKAYGHGLALRKSAYGSAFVAVGLCLIGTLALGFWAQPFLGFLGQAVDQMTSAQPDNQQVVSQSLPVSKSKKLLTAQPHD